MSLVDLTPRSYLKQCRSRTALQRWVLCGCLCALVAAVPIGIESSQQPDQSAWVARDRILQAESRMAKTQVLTQSVTAEWIQQERKLQASSHLTQRPDWSEVMGRVAAQFDGPVVMTGFRLGTLSDPTVRAALGAIAGDVPEDSIWLVLSGAAGENSDVPDLILRLEAMGLFERVLMTETRREAFAGAPRSGFILACRVQ